MCVCVCGGGGLGRMRRAADSSCWFGSHIVSLDKKLYSPLSLAPHVYKTGTRINSKDLFQLESAELSPCTLSWTIQTILGRHLVSDFAYLG